MGFSGEHREQLVTTRLAIKHIRQKDSALAGQTQFVPFEQLLMIRYYAMKYDIVCILNVENGESVLHRQWEV
jgi:hypothetical protein